MNFSETLLYKRFFFSFEMAFFFQISDRGNAVFIRSTLVIKSLSYTKTYLLLYSLVTCDTGSRHGVAETQLFELFSRVYISRKLKSRSPESGTELKHADVNLGMPD